MAKHLTKIIYVFPYFTRSKGINQLRHKWLWNNRKKIKTFIREKDNIWEIFSEKTEIDIEFRIWIGKYTFKLIRIRKVQLGIKKMVLNAKLCPSSYLTSNIKQFTEWWSSDMRQRCCDSKQGCMNCQSDLHQRHPHPSTDSFIIWWQLQYSFNSIRVLILYK